MNWSLLFFLPVLAFLAFAFYGLTVDIPYCHITGRRRYDEPD